MVVKCYDQMLIVIFMERAIYGFKPLLSDLESYCMLDAAPYPATIEDAMQM